MNILLRLVGIGGAAASALLLVPATASAAAPAPYVGPPAAHAAQPITPNNVNTTIESHSRLRTAPTTNSGLVATTTATDSVSVVCFTRGQSVTSGGYTTNVWYFLALVIDPQFTAGNVWSWGGNVNTQGGVDPDPRVAHC